MLVQALQPPVPPRKSYLPFQLEAVQHLATAQRILLADEMGLGKTISVIGALNLLDKGQNNNCRKVLIVSPKSVIPNWQSELGQWLVDFHDRWDVAVAMAKRSGFPTELATSSRRNRILLINYDIVAKYRHELQEMGPWDILVCDEAHYLKNAEAMRTQALLGAMNVRKPKFEHALRTQRLWLLTGSPMLNNPTELYPLLRSIDTHLETIPSLESFRAFGTQYSHRKVAPWGVTYRGGRNLAELRDLLRRPRECSGSPLMIRRTKEEVLPDLPPKRYQLWPLWDDNGGVARNELQSIMEAMEKLTETTQHPLLEGTSEHATPLHKKTVAELKQLLKASNLKVTGRKAELISRIENAGVTSEEEDSDTETRDNATEETELDLMESAQAALRSGGREKKSDIWRVLMKSITRGQGLEVSNIDMNKLVGLLQLARHETARRKVPGAIELIKQAAESHKVVVFAHHRDIQNDLYEAFGKIAVGIQGGDPMDKRFDAVHRFQTDPKVRVFVGSIQAAGTGITLNAASHVVFVEMDWSPLVVQQAVDRCHRVGQKNSVLVQYLYFPDTFDAYIAELLAEKQSTVTAGIDGPTGSASWVFDFGKYEGVCVGDVAGSDPSYLKWLVKEDCLEGRESLVLALRDCGFLRDEIREGDDDDVNETVIDDGSADSEVLNSTASSNWILDFGKHSGKSVAAVACDDPSYLKWIVNRNAHSSRPELTAALEDLGFLGEPEVPTSTEEENDTQRTKPSGGYIMKFGKHKGQRLQDIPRGYLHWIRFSSARLKDPSMAVAVAKFLKEEKSNSKPSPTSRDKVRLNGLSR